MIEKRFRRLFVVEDVFKIKSRGVAPMGKLDAESPKHWRIEERVEIRRQGVCVSKSAINGIPMGLLRTDYCEVLLRGLVEGDVQPGDEVWVEVED
jgi:translation elongation factor EF-Tu-like GTPase